MSAKLLNNYAFLVISLTMLGFAVSGVLLTRWLGVLLANLRDGLAASASLFALATVGVSAAFYHARLGAGLAQTRSEFVLTAASWLPLALLYALPFVCSGLALGLLLAAPQFPVRRVYCFDLAGSALGAVLVLPAIGLLGVERALLLACAALLAGTLVLAPPSRGSITGLAGLAVACLLSAWAFSERVFALRYPAGSFLAATQLPGAHSQVEHVAWDPLARIELTPIRPPSPEGWRYACLIGADREFHRRFRKVISQNNYAFTFAVDYDGSKRSLRGIEDTIYAAAYQATSVARPRVLVIGVGGGFDVLSALYFDASEITAVEINAATVGILTRSHRDYFRHWVEDPRLRLVSGEGRHLLSTTHARFDVVQLSGVDSYSGTPGAAHVFSENYLYTAEAFDLYLSRLTDAGMLNLMRLEFDPPREMLRALTSAVAALRRSGVAEPARHIVMLTAGSGAFTAMLVKKTPFSEAELARLERWTAGEPYFEVSAAPPINALASNAYQAFLGLGDPRLERRFIARYPFDIAPVDDDRPFFFSYAFWRHLRSDDDAVRRSVPVMEYSVILLTLLVGVAALFCVLVPLRQLARAGARAPGAARWFVYFAGTGAGYLAIEMALLQKFGLFLGHPNYALSIVLASLLLATGLGSLLSSAIVREPRHLRFVSYALAGVVLLASLALLPRLPALLGLPLAARAALVFLLVAPIGVCLGVFLPTALEVLKLRAPAFVPWAWGVNGIFSVLAPVASIAFSMTWGINALLLAGVPIYLCVGLALPDAGPGAARAAAAADGEPR